MLKIQKYNRAKSLEEAYASLMKNKNNLILGGMIWLKMEDRMVLEAIDLSDLGLDTILETKDAFILGSMVTLRQLETHAAFNQETCHIFSNAVKDIVGIQLRNMATLGGSLFSRFGFSDVMTALLALDTEVTLYHAGTMSLADFIQSDIQRDILVNVKVYKRTWKSSFQCLRKSATDISVCNVAVSKMEEGYRICVGARPAIATCMDVPFGNLEEIASAIQSQLVFGSNMRGSAEYRKHIAKVLILRALSEVE